MQRRTLVAYAAALALMASMVLSVAPADATIVTATSGSIKALFLDPDLDPVVDYSSQSNRTQYEENGFLDEYTNLVNLAASGSTIYASIYDMTSTSLPTALLNAATTTRNVSVNLILETCPSSPCSTPSGDATLLAASPTTYPGLHITRCSQSCVDSGGIDHNKFWVFSALTDGRTNLVVQASYNPTSSQKQMFNNMVEITGNTTLATGYRSYFARMVTDSTKTTRSYETGDVNAGSERAWYFPRNVGSSGENSEISAVSANPDKYTDVVAAVIDDVQCPATIDVAMWDFQSARSQVVDALTRKEAAGCSVNVATGEHQSAVPVLASGDGHSGGNISVYGMSPGGCRNSWFTVSASDAECTDGSIHSKFLLISGTSGKDGLPHSYVYTGSENYTTGALQSNDETMMRVDDPTIYAGYTSEFSRIENAAVQISPSVYPNAGFGAVNSVAANNQENASSASYTDASGNHITYVTYQSDATTAGTNTVWLARFSNGVRQWDVQVRGAYNGTTKTSVCSPTTATTNPQFLDPVVGTDSSGHVVVAWQDDMDGNGTYNVYACAVATTTSAPANGATTAYRVNTDADGQQTSPALAMAANGHYGVAWVDVDGSTNAVKFAAFASGSTRPTGGADVTIVSSTAGTFKEPSVAINASGTAVVAWADDADGNGSFNVMAKTGPYGGSFTGAAVEPNAGYTDGQQDQPAVAIAPSGTWYVAWADDHGCLVDGATGYQPLICVRAYSSANAAQFAPAPVSGPFFYWNTTLTMKSADAAVDRVGPQTDPQIAVDDAGNAVVAWTESPGTSGMSALASGADVWARGIDAAGTFTNGNTGGRFAENRMSVYTANDENQPTITSTGDGTFAIAYTDDWDGNGFTNLDLRYGFTD